MLFREVIAICSENYTKHISIFGGYKAESLDVRMSGAYGYYWLLNIKLIKLLYFLGGKNRWVDEHGG